MKSERLMVVGVRDLVSFSDCTLFQMSHSSHLLKEFSADSNYVSSTVNHAQGRNTSVYPQSPYMVCFPCPLFEPTGPHWTRYRNLIQVGFLGRPLLSWSSNLHVETGQVLLSLTEAVFRPQVFSTIPDIAPPNRPVCLATSFSSFGGLLRLLCSLYLLLIQVCAGTVDAC